MSHRCNKCDDRLVDGVNWTEAAKSKKHYTCKLCRSAYQRNWHSDNKERQNRLSRDRYSLNKDTVLKQQREKYIKKTFNITVEEYDSYFKEASCQICSKETDLVLDHCHDTGKIRGVLCRQCNMAIGLLGDNLEGLTKATRYLDENG